MLYDHLGNPVAVYEEGYTIMFSYWNGTSWTAEQLAFAYGGDTYALGGIRVDTLIYVYASYRPSSSSTIWLTIWELDRKGTKKNTTNLSKYTISYLSACYNEAAEQLHFSYMASTKTLEIISYNISDHSWDDPIAVDNSEQVGSYNDIAIDQNGKIWISYFDYRGINLKVARSKNADHTEWDVWFVDTEGSVGQYSQIWVDDSNVAHVAYYDATNQKLKYARFNP